MEPAELIENFDLFDDWEERYAYLIDLGKKLEPMEEASKIKDNLVPGCLSKVWLTCEAQGGDGARTLHFSADSDAFIVKGLIAILLLIYEGKTPDQVLALDCGDLFQELGLGSHVTMNRRNGFYSMLGVIRRFAEQHRA